MKKDKLKDTTTKLRILVIDDELETCELLKDILENEGYKVSIAVSGNEGLNLIKQHTPDFIICDVMMEGLDGIDVLVELKKFTKKIPTIMISAYGVQDKVVQALELGAIDFIAKPFVPKNIVNVVKRTLEYSKLDLTEKERLLKEGISPIRRLLTDSYISVLRSFAVILESKDPYIKEHSLRVTKYAVMLAKKLGLSSDEIEVIENTAYFHDIGKVGISDTILQKPGALDDKEWESIKKHPEIGYDIIEPLKLLHIALPGIRHHHERFDGNGYPDKLRGEDIPRTARILAIADAYEALTANRPYRKAGTPQEAVTELKKNAGTQFDPELVELFIEVLKEEEA